MKTNLNKWCIKISLTIFITNTRGNSGKIIYRSRNHGTRFKAECGEGSDGVFRDACSTHKCRTLTELFMNWLAVFDACVSNGSLTSRAPTRDRLRFSHSHAHVYYTNIRPFYKHLWGANSHGTHETHTPMRHLSIIRDHPIALNDLCIRVCLRNLQSPRVHLSCAPLFECIFVTRVIW